MTRLMKRAFAFGAALLAMVPAAAAAAPVRVVTTTEGLAALAREVGGDRVSVESLSRGVADPHYVDANPMLAVKLRKADLLLDVGLDLEAGWLPPLVAQSRNAEIQPGGKRRLTTADAVQVLDAPTGAVDRSLGDLHPGGNPHFLTDPRRGLDVAAAIAARLGELDPGGKEAYQANLAAFRSKLEAAMAGWRATLGPLQGRKLFTHHRTLSYFLAWSGLASAGELEPRPGVPPPPSHLAGLVKLAKAQEVKAVVVENYYDARSAETVARHAGVKLVRIPGDVGGERGAGSYLEYVGLLVERIAGGVR
ncbi:MAG TPA: metal ABC transporter substrate-binding protein [Anaeromyxobacter sp.]|nr:metal ABC transporter substrate-binding protein [Anaeromyxobacter sp.]